MSRHDTIAIMTPDEKKRAERALLWKIDLIRECTEVEHIITCFSQRSNQSPLSDAL
jgi:hypothetical protein